MSRGRFITLEGIEGAGKSTAAQALCELLGKHAAGVLLTREPGGTPLAESLRELLLRTGGERIPPSAETLMMFAARALHVENSIRPALSAGRWVVCDRFTDATFAYQGAARGVSQEFIGQLAAAVHGDLWPDRTLLFDLDVDVGLARARARKGSPDRFEEEKREFFVGVRSAYLALADRFPQRIRVIDAAQPAPRVFEAVVAAIADLLPP